MRNTNPALKLFWHPAALETDVPAEQPLRVMLLGEPWVLARLGGRIVAMVDRCPHRLVPLSAGRIVGDLLECRYHGYRFDARGRCVTIPALDSQSPIPTKACVETAPVEVRFGLVWVAPRGPLMPLLDDKHYRDPAFDTFVAGPFTTRAGASIITDNFLDVSHFPFLHRDTFGCDDDGRPHVIVARDGGMIRQYTTRVSGAPQAGGTVEMHYEYVVAAPFSVALTLTGAAGMGLGTNVVWSFCRPETDDQTTWWIVHAYDDLAHDPALIDAAREFQTRVAAEDLEILELMDDPNVPLEQSAEVHTKGDTGTLEYRRMLCDILSTARHPSLTLHKAETRR
ncbi:MAG: Rieske (2Fe-2S) iron-sulfur domain protein [Actinomycetia bacterium]|nr:Rieske (2Fe-2S) iron-sulfur domain protein [Actinomycetes bacterium]